MRVNRQEGVQPLQQVLKLCEEYDEVTLALLRQHVSGAYAYFSRNDFAWLHEHVMYERDCAVQRQQDQETLKKFSLPMNKS